jgi:hypothetical protein
MKRLIEEGLPQANQSIEDIRKSHIEEEMKEDDIFGFQENIQ